jgi:hypothetical protein
MTTELRARTRLYTWLIVGALYLTATGCTTETPQRAVEDSADDIPDHSCFGQCGGRAECMNGVAYYTPYVGNSTADCAFNPFPLCYETTYTCKEGCALGDRDQVQEIAQTLYHDIVGSRDARREVARMFCAEVPSSQPGDACNNPLDCAIDTCGLMTCSEGRCDLNGFQGEQPVRAADLRAPEVTLTATAAADAVFIPTATPGCAAMTLWRVDPTGDPQPVPLGLVGDMFAACGCACPPGDLTRNTFQQLTPGATMTWRLPLAQATPLDVAHACCDGDTPAAVTRPQSTLSALSAGSYRLRLGYTPQPIATCEADADGFTCDVTTTSLPPQTPLPACDGLLWIERDFTFDGAQGLSLDVSL